VTLPPTTAPSSKPSSHNSCRRESASNSKGLDRGPNEDLEDLAESLLRMAEAGLKDTTAATDATQNEIDQAIATEKLVSEANPEAQTEERRS
jgi:hypothetical protein